MAHPGPVSLVVSPTATLEPGDRFELSQPADGGRLLLPEFLLAQQLSVEHLEDETGRPLALQQQPGANSLLVPESAHVEAPVWLEYRAPGRFRLVAEKAPAVPAAAELRTEQGVPISLEPEDAVLLQQPPGRLATLDEFDLALRAA